MMPFADKSVLLGVCGSIAAYKACDLASRLQEQGAEVICALTASARQLVQPATFEALAGTRAITDIFVPAANPEISHVTVAQRVHLCLIAPATANMIAKAANGIADDWISTALLATRAPVLFAPAMNTNMYTHTATQENIRILRERGALFVGPASGRLACGSEGPGRMAEISDILDAALIAASQPKDYAGKRVLITSGPNHEPIDPMRYLGNRSSGKMGRALALEALRRGAEVCVVTGPAAVSPPHGAQVISVQTAEEMYESVMLRMDSYDIIIGAAAVADYTPETVTPEKIKRQEKDLLLRLRPNRDIIASVAARKTPNQRVVGFAAETGDILKNAEEKLSRKQLDMIIANVIGGDSCAVGSDRGDAYILTQNQVAEHLENMDKNLLAKCIFDHLADLD